MKLSQRIRSLLISFATFFGMSAFVVSCSFLRFLTGSNLPVDFIVRSARLTFFNLFIIAAVFVVFERIRKYITVTKPSTDIKEALEKITEGDFSVRLEPTNNFNNFGDIMKSINCMTAELSSVETLRKDFVSDVSHEIKTPLAVVQNYGTLLQTPGLSEEKRIEYAKHITENSRKTAELITNILKLNKLENQQIFANGESFNLSEQICSVLLSYENVWENKGINLETNIGEDVFLCADEELLSLVWSNLFSNAFKFTQEGGTVKVALEEMDGFVYVSVMDTGCGMSPETGRHIFEKFYQGDTSHATEGNGLGLALVKRIIDVTGGEISVSSTQGVGSTFTVKLKKEHSR